MDPSWPRKQEFDISMCASLFHDFQNKAPNARCFHFTRQETIMTCFSLSDAAHYTHYLKALSASVFARALYLSTCHLNGKALISLMQKQVNGSTHVHPLGGAG